MHPAEDVNVRTANFEWGEASKDYAAPSAHQARFWMSHDTLGVRSGCCDRPSSRI